VSASLWESLEVVPHRLEYRDIGGVRTRCLEAGSGRPVLLLHGTGGHLEAYFRNFAELSRYHRVIAYDLPGHGFSDSPDGYRYDWAGLSEHVLGAMSDLSAEGAVLVGEGLGAQLAQWIAIHEPGTIGGAALCCTLIVPEEDKELLVQSPDMARFQELSRRALEDPTEDVIRERMEWLMFDSHTVTDELVSIRLESWKRPEVRAAQQAILASYVRSPDEGGLRVTRPDAQSIETPLLVVWSRENPLMPAEVAKRFCTYPAGRCEYVEFDRAAMWPQYEMSEPFNELLLRFIDSLETN
jgi:2-hydroxy-6-oxonona-2,4-dienedioate hydrolase